jgi:hypothetical protein
MTEAPPSIIEAVESEKEMLRDLADRQGVMLGEYESRMEMAGIKELHEQIEVVGFDEI